MKKDKEIWFSAMKYGVGFGMPVTWQGWVVMLAYILLMLLGGLSLQISPFMIIPFFIYVFSLSGLLFLICIKKGEKRE